jgi:hypothetical protein
MEYLMKYCRPFVVLGALTTFSLAAPARAAAQVEIEIDPLAYAFNGFSLHAAKVLGQVRVNVGTFGIDVPRFLHSNDDWDARMRGVGVKFDYLGQSIDGLFVGADAGYMRMKYSPEGDPRDVRRDEIGVGIRTGYRIPIGRSGLYAAPWAGLQYTFNGDDVIVDGRAFERRQLVVFPTVHIGWRF